MLLYHSSHPPLCRGTETVEPPRVLRLCCGSQHQHQTAGEPVPPAGAGALYGQELPSARSQRLRRTELLLRTWSNGREHVFEHQHLVDLVLAGYLCPHLHGFQDPQSDQAQPAEPPVSHSRSGEGEERYPSAGGRGLRPDSL